MKGSENIFKQVLTMLCKIGATQYTSVQIAL